jgi:hypothetical protein
MPDEHAAPPGTWTRSEQDGVSDGPGADGVRSDSAWQGKAALAAVGILLVAAIYTLRDFLPALGWGAILAASLWPLHVRAAQRWPAGRGLILPAVFTGAVMLMFVIPLVMVASAVLHDSMAVSQWVAQAQAQGIPVPDILGHLPFGARLVPWWQATLATPEGIDRLARQAPHIRLATGEHILGLVSHRVLLLVFMLLTLFFILRDGERVAAALGVGTRRAFGAAGLRVAEQAVTAVRGTVNGLIVVGFGQGVVMGVAYAIAGVPHAALFGFLTGLLSAIPLGAGVAMALAAASLLAADQAMAAALVFAFGSVVIFVADHFVRPAFIGGATRLPFLWVLLAILGGIETWGLIGLVIGPALVAALMLLWREWVGSARGPLNPPHPRFHP